MVPRGAGSSLEIWQKPTLLCAGHLGSSSWNATEIPCVYACVSPEIGGQGWTRVNRDPLPFHLKRFCDIFETREGEGINFQGLRILKIFWRGDHTESCRS